MRKTLGEILVEDGIITEKELSESLKAQSKSHLPLGQIIQKKGIAWEFDILRSLSKLHGLEFYEKIEFNNHEELFKQIPLKLIQKSKIVPFDFKDEVVHVAITNPTDLHPMDDIKIFLKGFKVKFYNNSKKNVFKFLINRLHNNNFDEKTLNLLASFI